MIHVIGSIAKSPIGIDANATLLDAMKVISETGARHLLVVDDGVITGIATLSDVIAYLAQEVDLSTPISAIATQRIYSARPETTCTAAARAMAKLGVTSLLLTDGRIVAERDILRVCRPSRGTPVASIKHEPAVVDVGSTILDVIRAMASRHRRHAVITEGNRVVAVVSARDIIRAIIGGSQLRDPIDPIASWGPVTIGADMDAVDALDLMIRRDIWYLPIIGDEGLIGAVSDYDMISLLALEK